MSNQKLGILAVVAAVMVLWAVVQARLADGGRARPSGPSYLIQGLEPSAIASITVGEGDEAVNIAREDGKFVVVDEAGYPADVEQIEDLIFKCLDIKTTELYTDKPANHEALGVTEEEARSVVKFFKADGSLLTGVLVGETPEGGQGAFARRADSNDVYLVQDVPWFRTRSLDYVDQEIVSAERADVNTVTVQTPEGTYTLVSQDDASDVIMPDLPAGKDLKESDAKTVLTAITSLRFDDVNRPSELTGLSFDHQYTVRLDDATEYRLRLAKKDDKTYLMAEAEYTDPTKVTMTMGKTESEEELKKKEAKLLAQEQVQRFNLRHKGWIYEIPDWKATNLVKAQSELLEEPAVAEEAEAEEVPASPEPEPAIAPVGETEPAEMDEPVEAPNVAPVGPEPATDEPTQPSQETESDAEPASQPGPVQLDQTAEPNAVGTAG